MRTRGGHGRLRAQERPGSRTSSLQDVRSKFPLFKPRPLPPVWGVCPSGLSQLMGSLCSPRPPQDVRRDSPLPWLLFPRTLEAAHPALWTKVTSSTLWEAGGPSGSVPPQPLSLRPGARGSSPGAPGSPGWCYTTRDVGDGVQRMDPQDAGGGAWSPGWEDTGQGHGHWRASAQCFP